MVYCKNCGKENKKGKFCKFCGEKLQHNKVNYKKLLLFLIIPIALLLILEVVALNTPIEKENIFGSIKRGNYLLLGIEFCGNKKCSPDEL